MKQFGHQTRRRWHYIRQQQNLDADAAFERDCGESLGELVAAVRAAICDAAWEKYFFD